MASHSAQDALECHDFVRTHAGGPTPTNRYSSAGRVARVHSTLRKRTVPAARTSQATALRHSARRTTTSTTASGSARTNVPSASRPMLSINVGRENSESVN
jgi:hypothetical protein